MNKRIAVFAIETTKDTSQRDIEDFIMLMSFLENKFNFRWSRTANPGWVRALAEEMEKKSE